MQPPISTQNNTKKVVQEEFEKCSDWNSPIVLVPKADRVVSFCVDFCKLNMVSQFDAYPMSFIDELLNWQVMGHF